MTDADASSPERQEPDPLGRELAQVPDLTVVVDAIASSKWNEPMPIEASWGPSQGYLDANAAWDATMAQQTFLYQTDYFKHKNDFIVSLINLAVTGDNKYLDQANQILAKNPNFFIEINGQISAGQTAADSFNTALSKLPGDPLGMRSSRIGAGVQISEKTRPFTPGQAQLFEEAYGLAQQAMADSTDCHKAVAGTSLHSVAFSRNPSGNLERLHYQFVYGGDGVVSEDSEFLGLATPVGVTLFAGFFDPDRLNFHANKGGRFAKGPFKTIEYAQVRGSVILHELRHKINGGRDAIHTSQKESMQWDIEIMNSCFPKGMQK